MPKDKKLALKIGIQTYQILTNDDEVCIPSHSSMYFLSCIFYVMSVSLVRENLRGLRENKKTQNPNLCCCWDDLDRVLTLAFPVPFWRDLAGKRCNVVVWWVVVKGWIGDGSWLLGEQWQMYKLCWQWLCIFVLLSCLQLRILNWIRLNL